MKETSSLYSLVREHKGIVVIAVLIIFLLEIEIFAVAALKSGKKSVLKVFDTEGNLVHEADGKNLSEFNRYYFEKTFGPLKDYRVKLVTRERPFPFRAWFVAAVGIPVGIMLLLSFLLKCMETLFVKEKKDDLYQSGPNRIYGGVARINIFITGLLVFGAVIAFWVVPNFTLYIGRITIEAAARYRWVFFGIAAAGFCLVVWIIYLRYLLAKKSMESRMELEKYRLQLACEKNETRLIEDAGQGKRE